MATVNITDIKTLIGNQLGSNGISDDQRIVEDLGAESADVANIIAAVEDKYMHHRSSRGRGPSTWGKIRRDNVGKVRFPAGADSNLQRPCVRG